MVNSPKLGILWTLCYLSSLIILAIYSWNIVLGVWRSSNNYEKSGILSFFAKLFIIGIIPKIIRLIIKDKTKVNFNEA
jgi:TRAP-type C4-dicarboxylate transport system permease small subunit